MNFFTIFCASLVCVSLGEPELLNNLISSSVKKVGNKLDTGKNSKTVNNATDVQNKIEDQEKNEVEDEDKNEIEDEDENETEDQDENEIKHQDENKTNKKKSSNFISKFGKTLSGVTKKIQHGIESRTKKVTKDQDENEVEDKEKNETEDQNQNKTEDQDQEEKKTKNKKPSNFLSKVGENLGGLTKKIIGSAKKVTAKVTKTILEKVTNKGVNFLLRQYKRVVQSKDPEGNLTLPDIESKGFAYKVSATGGSFISLSSLEKNGKINFTRDSGKVFIDIPVKLTRMHVGYKEVSATVTLLKTSGSFSIDIKNNSISIKLRLKTFGEKNCAIRVEKVTITELGDFNLELKGFNKLLSKVTNKISTFLNNHMKKVLTLQIQKAIDKKLKETVESNSKICSKLMPVK